MGSVSRDLLLIAQPLALMPTKATFLGDCLCNKYVDTNAPFSEVVSFIGDQHYPFQWCSQPGEDEADWQPATYSMPPVGGVVGCCEWEVMYSSECSTRTEMNCPYGKLTSRGYTWSNQAPYFGHCMTYNEMWHTVRIVLAGFLALTLLFWAIGRYCASDRDDDREKKDRSEYAEVPTSTATATDAHAYYEQSGNYARPHMNAQQNT